MMDLNQKIAHAREAQDLATKENSKYRDEENAINDESAEIKRIVVSSSKFRPKMSLLTMLE